MTISYDRETDSLTITLRHERVSESDEIHPDVIADLAADGRIVRFEILRASQLVEHPDRVTLEIAEPVVATHR
ncbi:MAG TPA: DUF2283 domain-containing protein [Thermomicrobiales bacterium]|jgi:uncharacterized protein YuzE